MPAHFRISFYLFLGGMALLLLQLWFQPWSGETYGKLIVTVIAFFVVAFVWEFLRKEAKDHKKIDDSDLL